MATLTCSILNDILFVIILFIFFIYFIHYFIYIIYFIYLLFISINCGKQSERLQSVIDYTLTTDNS